MLLALVVVREVVGETHMCWLSWVAMVLVLVVGAAPLQA